MRACSLPDVLRAPRPAALQPVLLLDSQQIQFLEPRLQRWRRCYEIVVEKNSAWPQQSVNFTVERALALVAQVMNRNRRNCRLE